MGREDRARAPPVPDRVVAPVRGAFGTPQTLADHPPADARLRERRARVRAAVARLIAAYARQRGKPGSPFVQRTRRPQPPLRRRARPRPPPAAHLAGGRLESPRVGPRRLGRARTAARRRTGRGSCAPRSAPGVSFGPAGRARRRRHARLRARGRSLAKVGNGDRLHGRVEQRGGPGGCRRPSRSASRPRRPRASGPATEITAERRRSAASPSTTATSLVSWTDEASAALRRRQPTSSPRGGPAASAPSARPSASRRPRSTTAGPPSPPSPAGRPTVLWPARLDATHTRLQLDAARDAGWLSPGTCRPGSSGTRGSRRRATRSRRSPASRPGGPSPTSRRRPRRGSSGSPRRAPRAPSRARTCRA